MASKCNKLNEITEVLNTELTPKGFESHPFLIGWYNETVGSKFKLNYSDSTLAFLIISTPSMFEKAILPFIQRQTCDFKLDPVDSCIREEMLNLQKKFPNNDVEVFHDFQINHNRRPLVLVQTAGHVAGAAYFYQRNDITDPPWSPDSKIFGVSVHPKYGGWFALRCILVFKDVECSQLPRREPIDCVPENERRIELLQKFNDCWQDWTYRDVVEVKERYSQRQQEYFATLPSERKELLNKWKRQDE